MIYVLLIASSFLAAFISGAAGFGGALLLLPVATACLGAEVAVPVLTIAQLIGNASRMAFGIMQIAWKQVLLFCLAALPLAAFGAFGFSVLPKDVVTRCIGAALAAFVLRKQMRKQEIPKGTRTILIGGAVTGLVSGLAGSGGPIGAAVFLSLGLPPVAYVASEAATATAMHALKIVVYSKLMHVETTTLWIGLAMGAAMIGGTFAANKVIRMVKKASFEKVVAILLGIIGMYMLIAGD